MSNGLEVISYTFQPGSISSSTIISRFSSTTYWSLDVTQSTGTSTTSIMSQDAVTKSIYRNISAVSTDLVFGIENLLSAGIESGYQYASSGYIKDPSAAASPRISVSEGDIILIQGFRPSHGLYMTYMSVDGEILNINVSSNGAGSEGSTIFHWWVIPENVGLIGVTLYRNNNDETNLVPFKISSAIIAKISEDTALPLTYRLKEGLSSSEIEKNTAEIEKNTAEIERNTAEKTDYPSLPFTKLDGFIGNAGLLINAYGHKHQQYDINDSKKYIVGEVRITGSGLKVANYFDAQGNFISGEYDISTGDTGYTNIVLHVPKNTATLKLNVGSSGFEATLLEHDNRIVLRDLKYEIDDRFQAFTKSMQTFDYTELEPIEIGEGLVNGLGEIITSFSGFSYKKYAITHENAVCIDVKIQATQLGGTVVYMNQDVTVGSEFPVQGYVELSKEELNIPKEATHFYLNYSTIGQDASAGFEIKATDSSIDVINRKVEVNTADIAALTAKNSVFRKQGSSLYIKSNYDETYDMVIVYSLNDPEKNVSPRSANLTIRTENMDDAINNMILMHITSDSTPPFLLINYWYLFGEHGYVVPTVTSENHNKTAEDLGSIWESANSISMKLIDITDSVLTFAPTITVADTGRDTRDWNYETEITSPLTHVSGATHGESIVIETSSFKQIHPFTKNISKRFFIDGLEVFEDGDYNFNTLKIIDVHEGYNPSTIDNFDPISGDKLVTLTFTHTFKDLFCFTSNLVKVHYPMWINYYGAFQPMGLRTVTLDNTEYDPYVIIPKVLEQSSDGKITVDWNSPQNCGEPNQNWAKTSFDIVDTQIKDIDNIPERIVEWHEAVNGSFGIGFAAGYSLLSGLAVSDKRKDLTHNAFHFTQDERNKFYPQVLQYSKFEDQVLPEGWIGNFNFYYSYFKPEKIKVYYYEEGGDTILYVHSSQEEMNAVVSVPIFLEGRVVKQVIEKTESTILEIDTVINGSLILTFGEVNSYIVLKF